MVDVSPAPPMRFSPAHLPGIQLLGRPLTEDNAHDRWFQQTQRRRGSHKLFALLNQDVTPDLYHSDLREFGRRLKFYARDLQRMLADDGNWATD